MLNRTNHCLLNASCATEPEIMKTARKKKTRTRVCMCDGKVEVRVVSCCICSTCPAKTWIHHLHFFQRHVECCLLSCAIELPQQLGTTRVSELFPKTCTIWCIRPRQTVGRQVCECAQQIPQEVLPISLQLRKSVGKSLFLESAKRQIGRYWCCSFCYCWQLVLCVFVSR